MRLIDADTLKAEFTGTFKDSYSPAHIKAYIDLQPTIDPVKHGNWKEEEAWDYSTYYRCSCCGEDFCTMDGNEPKENLFNYCPNCGAKMDEKGDC